MRKLIFPLVISLGVGLAVVLIVLLCLTLDAAFAADRPRVALPPVHPLTADCVADAAREYGLPLAALFGILAAENGRTGEARRNANGTWDLGAFQVNTVHINALLRRGFNAEAVLRDGCVNARAAAWVLRREFERTGDIWTALGAYHSRTPDLRDAYIDKVRKHLTRLGAAEASLMPGTGAEAVR
ncbi:MAG: lytic transglycosylase domain-containing protein [Desulfovibrio sp.]|jgi:hypothetical protein|nr:lytic transglycosylase domain-containing protein [Desulfovibrio sp.]